MARMRLFIVLVLAVTAGGGLAFATYNYVQRIPAHAVAMPTRLVVVAAANLDVGAEIKRDDVRTIEWPADSVPAAAMGKVDDVIGRGLILPVMQDELITDGKMAPKGAGAGLPPTITPGMRAVSVRVNEVIGVAGYVLPGTWVDVVAIVSPTQQPTDITSKVILTNVQVLAAGTKIERETDKDKPMPVTVVTLLVSPEEAERLTLASTEGKIQLALRNPLDKTMPATRGVRPGALFGIEAAQTAAARPRPGPGAPRVAPVAAPVVVPAPQTPTVEMIRGDKRAQETVREEQ
jgi:pilus assembly protein CpaB